MRIIAGRLKGRIIAETHGHRTHPMSEKIRGALFNSLGDIAGLSVLDAYAGTGALSFEAISRGAGQVTAIDLDKSAHRTIEENASTLGVEHRIKIVKAAATAWGKRHQNEMFDIVLLDPPYNAVEEKDLIKLLGHLKPGGVAVLSVPPFVRLDVIPVDFEPLARKEYGDAVLAFYRRIK